MGNRYLRKRGNAWHTNFAIQDPTDPKKRIQYRFSIGTSDEKQARAFRDKFVLPLITANNEQEAVRNMVNMMRSTSENVDRLMRAMAHEAGLDIREGRRMKRLSGNGLPVSELFDRYCEHRSEGNLDIATVNKDRGQLSAFSALMGDMAAEDVTDQTMDDFRYLLASMPRDWQKMKQEAIDATLPAKWRSMEPKMVFNNLPDGVRRKNKASVNVTLRTLRGCWSHAIEKKWVSWATVPGANVKFSLKGVGGSDAKVETIPRLDDVARLMEMPMPPRVETFDAEAWALIPLFARYSGLRLGEIARLTAKDIKTVEKVLVFDIHGDTKTQQSHRKVPVHKKLKPIVAKLKKRGGLLFPNAGNDTAPDGHIRYGHHLSKRWNKKAKDVGPFYLHGLRKFAESEMVRAEANQTDIDRIMGHKVDRVSAIYTDKDLQRWQKAINSIR